MEKAKMLMIFGAVALLGTNLALTANNPFTKTMLRADLSYSMTLDQHSAVVEKDMGYYHQVTIKNNKFDIIGWTAADGKLGSIKKATYGGYTWNGMIYNRSVINGFTDLTVNFSGGELNYLFTDFLMEDMSFTNGSPLTSGVAVNSGNKPYFRRF